MTLRRACAAVLLAALTAAAAPAGAGAAWQPGAPGQGASRATALPAGTQPSGAAAGRTVTLTWAAASAPGAAAPTGYEVRRTTSGVPAAASGTCAGVVAALTCADTAPPGSHTYEIRAARGAWRGAWGAASAAVTVAAPGLALSPTTLAAVPGTTSASVSSFAPGEAVTFRLGSAGGTLLATSPAAVTANASGNATATVTLPAGTPIGPNTIVALGATGTQATATLSYWPTPGLSLSPSTVTSLAASTTASVSSMAAAQAVTFRLDDPVSGTVLATSPASVTTSAGGAATASLTIPAGIANGAHTVYAVPADGPAASAALTVNVTPASPTALTIADGGPGQTRRPDAGDVITVTFSGDLRPSSLCSAWPVTSSSQSTTGTVRLRTAGGQNVVDVTAAAGCSSFAFGTVELNRADFTTTADTVATWAGSTIAWSAATDRITITLGPTLTVTGSGTTSRVGNGNPPASTYVPSAAMLALGGVPVTGTFTSAPFVAF